MSIEDNPFPKYQMRVDGVYKECILRDAGLLLDNPELDVEFGSTVLLSGDRTRDMTEGDKNAIRRIYKEYAGYKK